MQIIFWVRCIWQGHNEWCASFKKLPPVAHDLDRASIFQINVVVGALNNYGYDKYLKKKKKNDNRQLTVPTYLLYCVCVCKSTTYA